MNSLGALLEDSDPKQAQRWYERAAQADHTGAMNSLGALLETATPSRPGAGMSGPPKPVTSAP